MLTFQITGLRKTKHAFIYISVYGTPYLAWNFSVSNIHSGRTLFTNQCIGNALSNSYAINSVLSKDCRMYILHRLRLTYHSESHKIQILVFFPNSLTRTQDQRRNIYCKWLGFFCNMLCHSINQSFANEIFHLHLTICSNTHYKEINPLSVPGSF